MKAWREVAFPHDDVLRGTLRQAEFAADLTKVFNGTASDEYKDPVKFFDRTYITEGMRILLVSLVKRLCGGGAGDPVIQLKTNFGGGKTHTMLAVYHLATRSCPTGDLRGIAPILNEAGVADLPQAKAVVIDGLNFAPNQPCHLEDLEIKTLWGYLGYRLLGRHGYDLVAQSDNSGTSPSKDLIVQLFNEAGPCVILCDELTRFMSQLVHPKGELTAGTFAANTSFIQQLTEAATAVDTAVVLASLPESDAEVGGEDGVVALEVLKKYFGRVESVWKPVGTEESFEIVRRRLFANIGDEHERDATCQAFADMYRANPALFPVHVQESGYLEKMKKCYPIHPELFDRLYNDWATLDNFQCTRGVLQYMAIVIHRLYNHQNTDPLIMPGSLPLSDRDVEQKSTHYLKPGWTPVVESEIDGPNSFPVRLESRKPLYGGINACCRTTRTIFFGSAPSSETVGRQAVRGIDQRQILLGAALPGHSLGVYETVLGELNDNCKYLYVNAADQRFWYDRNPNLLQEMRTRKEKVRPADYEKQIHEVVTQIVGHSSALGHVYVFSSHADIGDNLHDGLDLVVMRPDMSIAYSQHARPNQDAAYEAAKTVLASHGATPRINTANRLVFLFPEVSAVNRLIDQAKTFLAWKDIVDSYNGGALNLDALQYEDAKTKQRNAKSLLEACAQECYKHALVPETDPVDGRTLRFQSGVVTGTPLNCVAQLFEEWMIGEELLVPTWSPILLAQELERYFAANCDVALKKLWKDICQYSYFPKLKNESVLILAAEQGVRNGDSFGYADGKIGENYSGFKYGEPVTILGSDTALLISHTKAEELHKARKCPACGKYPCTCETPPPPVCPRCGQSPCTCETPPPPLCPRCGHSPCTCGDRRPPDFRHFYGTVSIDPHGGAVEFLRVMDNVVNVLNASPGVNVEIKVNITADSAAPFDNAAVIRPVTQNCTDLHFDCHTFE